MSSERSDVKDAPAASKPTNTPAAYGYVAIEGLIGAGRSEIVRAICRLEGRASGDIALNGRTLRLSDYRDSIREGLVYLSEDRKGDGLFLTMPIAANISALDTGLIANRFGSRRRGFHNYSNLSTLPRRRLA